MTQRIELLAPARTAEIGRAAILHGADAAREIAAQGADVPVWPEFANAEDAELKW